MDKFTFELLASLLTTLLFYTWSQSYHFLTLPVPFVWQLTLGLYEFKVIVNGDNAHGEGMVNVTVKPGMLSSYIASLPSLVNSTVQLGGNESI